jgi:hypothetical protein
VAIVLPRNRRRGGQFLAMNLVPSSFSLFGNVADPDVCRWVHDEGIHILENIANIRVVTSVDRRSIVQLCLVNGMGARKEGSFN